QDQGPDYGKAEVTVRYWYREFVTKLLAPFQGPLQRERDRIRAEILGIHGLMPLLMKQRNGLSWTAEDRTQLSHHLRQLTDLSPYLVVFLAPGSFVLVPLVAWWLDRRRLKRRDKQTQTSQVAKSSGKHP